jgi:hypothetical protein
MRQRAMIAAIHALEQELAAEAAAQEKAAAARHPISNSKPRAGSRSC